MTLRLTDDLTPNIKFEICIFIWRFIWRCRLQDYSPRLLVRRHVIKLSAVLNGYSAPGRQFWRVSGKRVHNVTHCAYQLQNLDHHDWFPYECLRLSSHELCPLRWVGWRYLSDSTLVSSRWGKNRRIDILISPPGSEVDGPVSRSAFLAIISRWIARESSIHRIEGRFVLVSSCRRF